VFIIIYYLDLYAIAIVIINLYYVSNIILIYLSQIHALNTDLITDPNLVLENVTKFACIAKELKWDGPILLMTDCTKIHPKLVYSQELGYITGFTLLPSEVSISDINDIHAKIRYIYENNAIATQIWVITLKVFLIL
jgi:hypothetical protein